MPYKLQIKADFKQSFSEDFKKWLDELHYLRPMDIVRGIDCHAV